MGLDPLSAATKALAADAAWTAVRLRTAEAVRAALLPLGQDLDGLADTLDARAQAALAAMRAGAEHTVRTRFLETEARGVAEDLARAFAQARAARRVLALDPARAELAEALHPLVSYRHGYFQPGLQAAHALLRAHDEGHVDLTALPDGPARLDHLRALVAAGDDLARRQRALAAARRDATRAHEQARSDLQASMRRAQALWKLAQEVDPALPALVFEQSLARVRRAEVARDGDGEDGEGAA